MSRRGGAFWFIAVIATGMANFIVKQTVQNLDDELTSVRRKTVVEQKELHELSAGWTFLNQPELLSGLNKRYLGLVPVSPKQIVTRIDDLPLRPAPPPAPDTTAPVAVATPAVPVQLAAATSAAPDAPEPAAAKIPPTIPLEPPTPTASPAAAVSSVAANLPTPGPAAAIPLDPPTPVAASAPPAAPAPAQSPRSTTAAPMRFAAAPGTLDALFAQVAGDR